MRIVSALLGAFLLLAAPQAQAAPERAAGLRESLSADGAVRTVFFVKGMSCRACTLLLDRSLSKKEGIYWARFNYPLRIFVAYHDPKTVRIADLEAFVDQTGELKSLLLASDAAGGYQFSGETPVAAWKNGTLSAAEAKEAPAPFMKVLEAFMVAPGTEEWYQVAYEIAGEEVRNRILREEAQKNGYNPGGWKIDIPVFIAKDFYWPTEKLPPTPEEAAVSLFIREKVILDDESDPGRERFDIWLMNLWRERDLDFRGELLELQNPPG